MSQIASSRTGSSNSFFGKQHTAEVRKILSEKNGFPVEMVDLSTGEAIRRFTSATDASRFLINQGIVKAKSAVHRILYVCQSGNPHHRAYGYNWRFVEKV